MTLTMYQKIAFYSFIVSVIALISLHIYMAE
jgi:hypothetical protein